jgi:uncharacterized protein
MTNSTNLNNSVSVNRLLWAAPAAGAVAAVGNMAVWAVARGLSVPLDIPMGPQPDALTALGAGPIIAVSFIPALLAGVLLAVLGRFFTNPLRVFQILAGAGLLLSLIGPLVLPVAGATKVVLLTMHMVAAAGIVGVLSSLLLRQALEGGHIVNALVRHPEKLTLQHPNLTLYVGDALKLEDVRAAVQGQEAVITALGGGMQGPFDVLTAGLSNILEAMQENDIRRIVATAAAGVLQHDAHSLRRDQPDFPPLFKVISQAHLEAYSILQSSTIGWTLLCPPMMPEGAATGQYRVLTDYAPEGGVQISTGDLAHFALGEVERQAFLHKRVGIAY